MAETATVGSYVLERELGRGGMGAVYAGVHQLLGRRAAVKVLLPDLSRKQDLVQRFFNEARAATAIHHPSIVDIYDFGYATDGSAYIVMELLEGDTLAARLKSHGPMSIPTAVALARQVANALGAAHAVGIVHRDLKPDNVFLVKDPEVAGGERVKLLDFGIAKLATETAGPSRTVTGMILGTPAYMSPEQCEGAREVDQRTDLYSLGCMLFQMLSGSLPFESPGAGGLIGMHLHVPPPLLRTKCPQASAELEAVVAKLLAKSLEERFQIAEEVVVALSAPEVLVVRPGAVSSTARVTVPEAIAATMATPGGSILPGAGARLTTELDRQARAPTVALTDPEVAPPVVAADGQASGKGRVQTRGDATVPSMPPDMTAPRELEPRQPVRSLRSRVIVIVSVIVVAVGGVVLVMSNRNEAGGPSGDTGTGARGGSGLASLTGSDAGTVGGSDVGPQPVPVDAAPVVDAVVIDAASDDEEAVVEALLTKMKEGQTKHDWSSVQQGHDAIFGVSNDPGVRASADAIDQDARDDAERTVDRYIKKHDCSAAIAAAHRAFAAWADEPERRLVASANHCQAGGGSGSGSSGSGSGSTGSGGSGSGGSGSDAGSGSGSDATATLGGFLRAALAEGRYAEGAAECKRLRPRRPLLVRLCVQLACKANDQTMFHNWLVFLPPKQRAAARQECEGGTGDPIQGDPSQPPPPPSKAPPPSNPPANPPANAPRKPSPAPAAK